MRSWMPYGGASVFDLFILFYFIFGVGFHTGLDFLYDICADGCIRVDVICVWFSNFWLEFWCDGFRLT